MKKISLLLSLFLLIAILGASLELPDVKAAQQTENAIIRINTPKPEIPAMRLTYTELVVRDKMLLDEALCDFVSEDVVRLMDAGIDYSISEWIEKPAHTYLFFKKELPEGTLYTACGYARLTTGRYVYFELSSPEKLTEEMVNLKIRQSFGGDWSFESANC